MVKSSHLNHISRLLATTTHRISTLQSGLILLYCHSGHAAFESFFQTVAAASREEVTGGPGTAVQVEKPRGKGYRGDHKRLIYGQCHCHLIVLNESFFLPGVSVVHTSAPAGACVQVLTRTASVGFRGAVDLWLPFLMKWQLSSDSLLCCYIQYFSKRDILDRKMEVAQFNSVQIKEISLNKLYYICDALQIKSQHSQYTSIVHRY